MGFLYKIDVYIFERLNALAGISQFFDMVIVFLAVYLWYLVVAGITLFVLVVLLPRFRVHLRRNAELFTLAFLTAFIARFVITEFIRFLYDRHRPFETFTGINQLVDHAGGGSFPSGHASLAFAVATAASFYYPRISIVFFSAAAVIGIGRIAAGIHWPSDILVGAMVGIITSWLIHFVWEWRKRKTA